MMMNDITEQTYLKAHASSMLALLSAIYTSESISPARREDIQRAVETAPDSVVLIAATVKHLFKDAP
jgi:hypothetical protein